ncbi:MAG TPA: chromosomal replication initiator protein DnaA [Acidimicrobiia bacterium]|nr:chromosomal replication initiator protein DnaA [Acidimicrobiia bacterium]
MEKHLAPEAADDLWQAVSRLLRAQLGDATYRTWLAGVQALDLQNGVLRLSVPHQVARQRIETAYAEPISEALRQVTDSSVDIQLLVETAPRETIESLTAGGAPELPGLTGAGLRPVPGSASPGNTLDLRDDRSCGALNPNYTFEQFVIGASNRFAHAAAMSVAEKPAASYNPLFIYGDSGLGKTHLLHAVGHHLCQLFPAKRVRYVTTEAFMNEFVEAIRTNSRPDFKRRYREVDLLLVDDVQFMQNHERLQEEFFHTFDSLHGSGSQLVLSSDRPPKDMATLEDRLRTRFEWGLLTDIQPPEYETRLAILRHKARAQGFIDTPDEVLAFIATHISDNVRELEGALIRVAAYASLTRIPATEELAREVLADNLRTKCSRVITPQVILEETAKMFGWTVDDLCGRSRRRPLVTARQIGMYVFRELTDYSYPQIAREFGGRDHTTVMHAVEKITDQIAERRQIYEQVSELITRIKSGESS